MKRDEKKKHKPITVVRAQVDNRTNCVVVGEMNADTVNCNEMVQYKNKLNEQTNECNERKHQNSTTNMRTVELNRMFNANRHNQVHGEKKKRFQLQLQ